MESGSWTYKRAGVDLSKHRLLHEIALESARSLNEKLGLEVEGLGSYSASLKIGGLRVALHVDGVGTKTIVLRELKALHVAGWDCVAVNVNDMACDGWKPLALVDYIAMPEASEEEFAQIIDGLVRAASEARVGILGGETAIMPDLVSGVDVVCSVLAVEREAVSSAREGDVLVGVESWGLHANGYTLVRRLLREKGLAYRSRVGDIDLALELAKPTAIYSNLLLEAYSRRLARAAAHVTGGGFTKLRRILGFTLDARIAAPRPPPVFEAIRELGRISYEEMYRVFNMGVGLVVAADSGEAEELVELARRHGFNAGVIGTLTKGSGRILLETWRGDKVVL